MFAKKIKWFSGALLLFVTALLIVSGWHERTRVLSNAKRANTDLVQALQDNVQQRFHAVQLIFGALLHEYQHHQLTEFWQKNNPSIRALLWQSARQVPHIFDLFLIDKQGVIVNAAYAENSIGSSVANQAYFIEQRRQPFSQLRVNAPIKNRDNQRLIIPVTWPILDDQGQFNGLLFAAVSPEFFHALFKRIDIGENGTVILALTDTTTLIREPDFHKFVGKALPNSSLKRQITDYPNSDTIDISPFDQRLRLISYRTLDDYGLLISINRSVDSILKPWHQLVSIYTIIWIVLFFLIFSSTRIISKHLNIQEGIQKQLHEAQALAHLGSWSYIKENHQLEASIELRKIFCLPLKNHRFYFDDFARQIFSMDWKVLKSAIDKTLSEGTAYQIQVRVKRGEGWQYLIAKGNALINSNEEIIGLTGTFQDVTSTELLQQALSLREERFRLLTTASRDGFWDWDLISGQVWYSARWKEQFGYQENELSNTLETWQQLLVSEKSSPNLLDLTHESLLTQPYATYIQRFRHKDGHLVSVHSRIFYLFNDHGEPCRIMGAQTDITEQQRLAQALRNQASFHQLLLDAMPNPIFYKDKFGKYLGCNRAFEERFQVMRTDLIGHMVDEFIPCQGIDSALNYLNYSDAQVGEHPNVQVIPIQVYYPCDEKNHDVLFYFSPFEAEPADLSGFIGVLVDITEIRNMQRELQRLNDNLEQRVVEEVRKNRDKDHLLIQQARLASMGEMIGNIAHQWRQPLNALGLVIANLRDAEEYGELDNIYLSDSVQKAEQLIEGMSGTIDDFRYFFRPNKQKSNFSPAESIQQALRIVQENLLFHKIELSIAMDKDLLVSGFANEYAQVVLNLLSNAKDALLEREISHPHITLQLSQADNQALLQITDNAGGVADDLVNKVFDPYFTTKSKGTGIGLYMSKMIIENNMGGEISLYNQANGAVFSVRLPVADTEAPLSSSPVPVLRA